MPDRIIREKACGSPTLAALSDSAERAFWRLTVTVDDHGRFDAHPEAMLNRMFLRKPFGWTRTKMERTLEEWVINNLVILYSVDGRSYGYIPSWPRYQRPPRLASKYPDPPGKITIPAEQAIHAALFSHLRHARRFCDHEIVNIDRNVRAGNGFADLVLLTGQGRLVIEIKRTRADIGTIRQVSNYVKRLKDVLGGIIIATGIGPNVDALSFRNADLALITYDEEGHYSLAISSTIITKCDIPVISHSTDVKSQDITHLPETRSEKREARSEKREARDPSPFPPPEGWGSPDALCTLYNTATPDECPAVETLSPARRDKARRYLAMFPTQEFWAGAFQEIGRSRFLRGLVKREGHTHFVASFDWLLTKGKDGTENIVKVAEGRYRDGA